MGFKARATSGGQSGLLPAAGTHPAVLVALIGLGTHHKEYKGSGYDPEMIYLVWELTAEEGRPLIGRDFTLSLGKKAKLREFLERWRGKSFSDGEEFEIEKVLGKGCL